MATIIILTPPTPPPANSGKAQDDLPVEHVGSEAYEVDAPTLQDVFDLLEDRAKG